MDSIVKTYVSATEVVEYARKVAENVRYEYQLGVPSLEEKRIEDQVLGSLSVIYYDNGSERYNHTVGASLIEIPDAMPYMEYPQWVLIRVNEDVLLGAGNVWKHSVAQWRISWDPKES